MTAEKKHKDYMGISWRFRGDVYARMFLRCLVRISPILLAARFATEEGRQTAHSYLVISIKETLLLGGIVGTVTWFPLVSAVGLS